MSVSTYKDLTKAETDLVKMPDVALPKVTLDSKRPDGSDVSIKLSESSSGSVTGEATVKVGCISSGGFVSGTVKEDGSFSMQVDSGSKYERLPAGTSVSVEAALAGQNLFASIKPTYKHANATLEAELKGSVEPSTELTGSASVVLHHDRFKSFTAGFNASGRLDKPQFTGFSSALQISTNPNTRATILCEGCPQSHMVGVSVHWKPRDNLVFGVRAMRPASCTSYSWLSSSKATPASSGSAPTSGAATPSSSPATPTFAAGVKYTLDGDTSVTGVVDVPSKTVGLSFAHRRSSAVEVVFNSTVNLSNVGRPDAARFGVAFNFNMNH